MTETADHNVEWMRWIEVWVAAAGRQADRIASATYEEMQPDVLLFVQAVNNVRRGAVRVLGADHPDVAEFDASQPGLKDLRDMLEHFDAYVEGQGWRQRNNKITGRAAFIPMYQKALGSEFKYATILLADKHIEVFRLNEAARTLALAAHLQVSRAPRPVRP